MKSILSLIFFILIVCYVVNRKNKRIDTNTNNNTNNNISDEPLENTTEEIKLPTNYSAKYIKRDYLLSKTELKFYRILKQITDKLGYSLFSQVSLYQLVKNEDFKDFNKIQSKSIDFVITQENCKILLCIELDDKTHNQTKRIERDNFINELFNDINIKLLRIPVQGFYNQEELKQKIVESLN